MSKSKTPTIDALGRGVDLLEILGDRDVVKLSELPELLSTSRATSFRVLKTLEERGYVEHLPAQRAYRLGPAALMLAVRSRASSFVRSAEPAMRDLAERTGETVNLALLRGGRLVYVEIVEGQHALRMSGEVGQAVPIHATALGKAILSVLPSERQRELLGEEPYRAYTAHTHTTWQALQKDLREAAKRRFAVEAEEMDAGAVCIGSAIVGVGGYPLGGLSVSGWVARLGSKERAEIGEHLKVWTSKISKELGNESDGSRPAGPSGG